nr:unnamed protein product [Callosobruchus analis]
MELKNRIINLQIRRYDVSENPRLLKKTLEIAPDLTVADLKKELQNLCTISDDKVIKIRYPDNTLVPMMFLLDSSENTFYIDVTNISYVDKQSASLLQDAYIDAVKQKIRTLESRIGQSETLLPQLEWRRQAYMEDTVNGLLNKVAFLNRRFDELLPQYMAKAQQAEV